MKRKILVVDDYEEIRTMIRYLLESCGYDVLEAADGFEAVKNVKRVTPDLILMDFAMPNMNGIEATKAIRRFESGGKIPILCVTAYGNQFQEEAINAGFDEVIPKPVDYDSLLSIIRRYLKEEGI